MTSEAAVMKLSAPLRALADLDDESIALVVNSLSDREAEAIATDWSIWARPQQLMPPGSWRSWLVITGRGWGKTRSGSGATHEVARHPEQLDGGVILIGDRTYSDLRKYVIEGESGIVQAAPSDFRPEWFPGKSTGELHWPNGVKALCLTGDHPRAWRGGNAAFGWLDELAHYAEPEKVWANFQYSLRKGICRAVVTTTPTSHPIIREIMDDPDTVTTQGSTDDNIANLAPEFVRYIFRKYAGTRFEQQERFGVILDDAPGALWSQGLIDSLRVQIAPELEMVCVAIDPAVADLDEIDDPSKVSEIGIVVVGRDPYGDLYILEDLSGEFRPHEWAEIALEAYFRWELIVGAAEIVGEVNNGGVLVKTVIQAQAQGKGFTYVAVHASQSKRTRAEPIATAYEARRAHHVGKLPKLEKQMTTWQPGRKSPDRMDAMVWGGTRLLLDEEPDKSTGADAYWS